MTTLNTLTVINAAEKSSLFFIMNEIRTQAPEIAATLLENCTQHFNSVIALVGKGGDESKIGLEFGCGEIDSYELFRMVANQASEDLHVYIAKRDVAPINVTADDICFGDRLANSYTGDFEEVNDVYDNHSELTRKVYISTNAGTKLVLNPENIVTIKR